MAEVTRMEKYSFTLFGEDERQRALCACFRADGHAAHFFGEQEDGETDGLRIGVLPMPAADAPLDALGEMAFCVGGRIAPALAEKAADDGIRLFDYAAREDFALSNALTTAEAAIYVAMQHEDRILAGLRVLVIGCGRIARRLAPLARAMGMRVTVSARKEEDFLRIRDAGFACMDTRALSGLSEFDLIFNTVPAPVLGAAALAETREDVLLIDLASLPGGIDFECAKRLPRCAVHALALPGRYAPRTAARSAAQSIYAIISEDEHA